MNQSMGTIISDARKSKNMTQAELAEVLHVTDKAVSKWERNICCPDITLIPEIAKTLDISIEELLSGKIQQKNKPRFDKLVQFVQLRPAFGNQVTYLVQYRRNFTLFLKRRKGNVQISYMFISQIVYVSTCRCR